MVDHVISLEQGFFTRLLTRDLFTVAINRSIVQGSGPWPIGPIPHICYRGCGKQEAQLMLTTGSTRC